MIKCDIFRDYRNKALLEFEGNETLDEESRDLLADFQTFVAFVTEMLNESYTPKDYKYFEIMGSLLLNELSSALIMKNITDREEI